MIDSSVNSSLIVCNMWLIGWTISSLALGQSLESLACQKIFLSKTIPCGDFPHGSKHTLQWAGCTVVGISHVVSKSEHTLETAVIIWNWAWLHRAPESYYCLRPPKYLRLHIFFFLSFCFFSFCFCFNKLYRNCQWTKQTEGLYFSSGQHIVAAQLIRTV